MTREEKDLLLKDLCARLPYGVKCDYEGSVLSIDKLDVTNEEVCGNLVAWYDAWPVEKCKPYLRPLSSMTFDESLIAKKLNEIEYHDFLNAHHFDYRGLIEKGLALEAPEDMYKID